MTGESDNPDTEANEQMDWEAGANAKVTLTPNTSLTSDFIFSSKKLVATDVAVELADKNGLVESLDMSLKWGMFDISGGDEAETAARRPRTTCRTCSWTGYAGLRSRSAGGQADSGHDGHRQPA